MKVEQSINEERAMNCQPTNHHRKNQLPKGQKAKKETKKSKKFKFIINKMRSTPHKCKNKSAEENQQAKKK